MEISFAVWTETLREVRSSVGDQSYHRRPQKTPVFTRDEVPEPSEKDTEAPSASIDHASTGHSPLLARLEKPRPPRHGEKETALSNSSGPQNVSSGLDSPPASSTGATEHVSSHAVIVNGIWYTSMSHGNLYAAMNSECPISTY